MSRLIDDRLLPVATACMAAMVGNPGIVHNCPVNGWVSYSNQNASILADEAVAQALFLLAAVDERMEQEKP